MFVISFIANMIKRHSRCMKLITRNQKLGLQRCTDKDPFLEDEEDPIESRALKSCLWELDVIMKHHYDERVRSYCKVFKTDILRKQASFKCEEFS